MKFLLLFVGVILSGCYASTGAEFQFGAYPVPQVQTCSTIVGNQPCVVDPYSGHVTVLKKCPNGYMVPITESCYPSYGGYGVSYQKVKYSGCSTKKPVRVKYPVKKYY